MDLVDEGGLEYAGYSYKQQTDRYRLVIYPAGIERLKESAGLLPYSALEAQIRKGSLRVAEFFVNRSG